VAIPPDATSGDMESVLATLGAALLMPVVDALADGRAVETPQDHASATLAPKITKEEGVIDWTQPASMVHNRVRGLQPWPLASTTLAGARYVLRRTGARPPADPGARPPADPGARSADRHRGQASDERSADLAPEAGALGRSADLTPGTVVRAQGDELVVACGGGTAIAILEIQPEGRRTMTAREFLAGRGALAGARFGS
jgi:methionyl-tRNA formyltransferase